MVAEILNLELSKTCIHMKFLTNKDGAKKCVSFHLDIRFPVFDDISIDMAYSMSEWRLHQITTKNVNTRLIRHIYHCGFI